MSQKKSYYKSYYSFPMANYNKFRRCGEIKLLFISVLTKTSMQKVTIKNAKSYNFTRKNTHTHARQKKQRRGGSCGGDPVAPWRWCRRLSKHYLFDVEIIIRRQSIVGDIVGHGVAHLVI